MREKRRGRVVRRAAILWPPYKSMYGKAPKYMTTREAVIGLPGDVFVYGDDGDGRVAQ